MKKIVTLIVLVLGVFVLAACSNQGAVDIPGEVEANILGVVLLAVSWVLAKLIALWAPLRFLEEFRVPLAMAIGSQLIGFIETATPDAYGAVVILVIQLILAILALFLTAEKLRARGYRFF